MVLVAIIIIWVFIAPGCMTFRKADSVMKAQFEKRGITLTTVTEKVAGRKIHYAKTGSDTFPTLLFVHGTPGSWDAFANYMANDELLQKYRMISIDRPGFGYSNFGAAENLERQSQLMSPVLEKMVNGKPIYLVGHSLGAPMIIKLLADNPPGMFSGLVLISGSVDPAEEKPEKWRPWLFKTPLNFFVPGAFRPSNEELWYLKKDLVKLEDAYSKVGCPVYIIHGGKDTWVPPGNVEYAKKHLVNSPEIHELIIPDGNHFIPWTKFKEIKDVLLKLGSPN